jgi:hypothetical protein
MPRLSHDSGPGFTMPLGQPAHSVARLSLTAFPITDTELNVIAALAIAIPTSAVRARAHR